ncbi:MAG: hypothetical protein COS89_04995 [Deltaproteobacteria bacterium CG07_land_8_20_14_0_80_38_7]|nr:MAG: hypothetical protein COS89_04995 [Deltaproteobacteria bacterium CG07_land_8_20_14_0_80_38_7]
MRNHIIKVSFFIIFFLVGTESIYAKDLEWDKFVSKPGKFSILMPCEPVFSTEVEHSSVGNIHEMIFSCSKQGITFVVEYSDLLAIAVYLGGEHVIYKNSRKAFLKDVNGEKVALETIKIKWGFIGKELTYRTATDLGKVRFILAGKRLFVLQVYAEQKKYDEDLFDEFLDSFKQKYKKLKKHPDRRDKSWQQR